MIALAFEFWESNHDEMRAIPCSSWIVSPRRCRSLSSASRRIAARNSCGKRTASTDGRVHQVSPDSTAFASFERQGRTIATDRFSGILVATSAERGSNSTAHRRVAIHLQLRTFARRAGRQDTRWENAEVGECTPLSELVVAAYDESKERIRYSDWKKDQAMAAALHKSRTP